MAHAEHSIRTALFVDFDNIFITLSQQDNQLSMQFANNPDKWLDWIESKMPAIVSDTEGKKRRVLIRKCYLNPQVFAAFRPYFIRSAFEVIDCPPLTQRGKTSTDIHMVMDILDALNHNTRFDEFIIFSADADFTPVLLRLRANDRYSAVLSTGYVSPAYKAACDYVIPPDEFFRDALGIIYQEEEFNTYNSDARPTPKLLLKRIAERLYRGAALPAGIEANDLPAIYKEFPEFKQSTQWLGFFSLRRLTEALILQDKRLSIVEADPWRVSRTEYLEPQADAPAADSSEATVAYQDVKKVIAEWIINIVRAAQYPIPMASLAQGISENFQSFVANTDWLQTGSFKQLLSQLELNGLAISSVIPGYVYDPAIHQPPTPNGQVNQFAADVFSVKYTDIAPLAKTINRLTDTPYLLPEHYALLLTEIAREVNERGFHLSRTSKTVRDRCVEKGAPIARAHVNFVLLGIGYTGHALGEQLPENPAQLGEVLIANTINLCRSSQLVLTEQDSERIRQWITGALE